MKFIKTRLILILIFGCQNQTNEHIAIGTWNRCNNDGSYWEYKITDDYMLMLTTKSEDIWLFKNKVIDSVIVLSDLESDRGLLINNDTLITFTKSKDKVVLKSKYTWDKIELNKAMINIDEIDSTNFDLWKSKTLFEFQKRAKSANCHDLRSESEKEIPTLDLNDIDEI